MKNTPIKVVQILPELNEGGVERGTVELSREFVKQGMHSVVISKGGKLAEQIVRDGGNCISYDVCSKNPVSFPMRVLGLRRLFRQLKPDVIHVRSRLPAWLCHFANRKLNIPFVTTVHGLNSVNRYSRIMTTGKRVICVSEVVKSYIESNYSVNPDKLVVIQRGVDMQLFDPGNIDTGFIDEFRQRYHLHDKFIVASVGRITQLKDYETFIQSIGKCRGQIPNICGVIVGGAHQDRQEYFRSLQRLVHEQGLDENIIFSGSQTKMPEIYALSDVVVNASLKMGNIGRTVTEALAMNTPVIATTYEGLVDLVRDGVNGYLIRTQDIHDLSDKIVKVSESSFSNIRGTVDTEYTLDTMVNKTIGVYQSLLSS